jgi:hypothetical protein
MRKSGFFFVAPVVLLSLAISAALLAQDQKFPSQGERAKAVNVVRLINTAEVTYNMGSKKGATDGHGRYASWDDLYRSRAVQSVQDRWAMVKDLQLSAGPEVIPGYHLDLIVSPDGQSYSIALHDKKEGDGLFSVFSDSTGIIYWGAPLQ